MWKGEKKSVIWHEMGENNLAGMYRSKIYFTHNLYRLHFYNLEVSFQLSPFYEIE